MSKQQKILLIGGVILLMALLVWLISSGESEGQKVRRPFVSSNWTKKFQAFDKNPLGLYLFNRMLQSHLSKGAELKVINEWYELDSLRISDSLSRTYLFVGNNFGLQTSEIDSILIDVEKGSRLFLSYNNLTSNILNQIFDEYSEQMEYAQEIRVFAGKRGYKLINLFQNDTIATDWKAFDEIETDEPYVTLSSFMEMSNFLKIKKGKGYIYVQSNPEAYTNYQIKRKEGLAYAMYTIDQLPTTDDVVLLEVGRLTDDYGNEDVDDTTGDEGKVDDSYLKMIFENPTLLKAMLLGILGIVLFVVFRSKRIRPVVPFMEKKKDMTLAFAETITSIYFAKRNPYGLLQVQKKNFYTAVQKHFFIDLQRREGDRELITLAEKSNKSLKEIKELLGMLETTEAFSVNEQYVSQFNAKKRKFYLDTGIISEKTTERIGEREMVFRRSLWLPLLLILGSIALIITGFALLVNSTGIGIAFWPLGIFSMYLGIVRISAPLIRVSKEEIIYTDSFGRKKTMKREELTACDTLTKGAIMHFTENRKLIINLWDLSAFDKKQFSRFITKLHIDSYDK